MKGYNFIISLLAEMKRLVFAITFIFNLTQGVNSQTCSPLIYGASPFQDSLWAVDTTDWSIVSHIGPTLSGFTITGINGLAWDHCSHQTYCILKLSGVSFRSLATIDLSTGICTLIGNLGDNFSSISFRGDGQLFGVVGNGGIDPESVYMIDKTDATTTFAVHLGNGADGEIISFNKDDGQFYHWSGNGTVVYEKFLSSPPYTVTGISSGPPAQEIFGALYLGSSLFIVSTIASQFRYATTTGGFSSGLISLPDDFRGLVMPPAFVISDTEVECGEEVTWNYCGLTFDTIIYVWGDGTSDTLYSPGPGTHVYSSNGTYETSVVLMNNCNSAETFAAATIDVINCSEAPLEIICPGDTTENVVPGNCGKVITYTISATGGTTPYTFTQTDGTGYTSGQIFPVGTTVQTWMVTDDVGNTATCTFTITIVDNEFPQITGCPGDAFLTTDPGVCSTTHTWVAPTASDNCPGVSFSANYAPGATFNEGATDVIYTATDASGNTSTCMFTVYVDDDEFPTLTNCPEDINVNADAGSCSAYVEWTDPIPDDNCGLLDFSSSHTNGSNFGVGVHNVVITATDNAENSTSCTFTITVTDNQAPSVTCPSNAMRGTNEGVCKYTISGAEFNATASDNCGIAPPLTYTLSGATIGSGNTTLNGVMLNKGITTITWTATDIYTNTSSCSFTVEVKDNEAPKITCPADKMVVTAPNQCTAIVALGSPTTSDNCGVASTTNNAPNPFPVGMTTVTWTVTDVNGNTKTCTQKVTVVPYSCGVPVQVLHTDTTASTAKIKWKAGKCATSYELRIRMQISPGVWGSFSAWVPSTGPHGPPQWTHQFTGLTPAKFYNYQVRSVCGMSFSASINGWFNTLPSFAPIEDRIASEENESPELPVNIAFIPNPAKEFTTVMIEGFEQREKTITMFDLYGKLVFTVKVDANQNLLELDLDALNAKTGIYLIRVSDDRKQKTEQLMIER